MPVPPTSTLHSYLYIRIYIRGTSVCAPRVHVRGLLNKVTWGICALRCPPRAHSVEHAREIRQTPGVWENDVFQIFLCAFSGLNQEWSFFFLIKPTRDAGYWKNGGDR